MPVLGISGSDYSRCNGHSPLEICDTESVITSAGIRDQSQSIIVRVLIHGWSFDSELTFSYNFLSWQDG